MLNFRCLIFLSLAFFSTVSFAFLPPSGKSARQPVQRDAREIAEAELAFNGKDYNKAAVLYQILTRKNNPFAQYQLGYLYLRGFAVSKDNKLAFEWYKKAADQKLPEAKFALGLMYYYGLGAN